MKGLIIVIKLLLIITCYMYKCNGKKNKMKKNKYVLESSYLRKRNVFLKTRTNYFYIKLTKLKKKNTIHRINRKKKNETVEYFVKDPTEDTFLIVDGSSLLYKNYFGMPFLKTNDDINISTIYGFIQSLNKIYKLFYPKYILIVFDSKSSNDDKKKLYAKYKILRRKNPEEIYEQLHIVNTFCDTIGIKTVISEKTESDNYIAEVVGKIYNTVKNEKTHKKGLGEEQTVINGERNKETESYEEEKKKKNEVTYTDDRVKYENRDSDTEGNVRESGDGSGYKNGDTKEKNSLRVVIVSSDKDLLQLLEYDNKMENFKIRICQPNKKYKVFDTQTFIDEYELMPNQYSDFLIMMGDKTDCIPGIPQIGNKTSKCLLKQYTNIDDILTNVHKLPEKLYNIFINNLENIKTLKKLIQLKTDTTESLVLDDYKQKHITNFDMYQNFLNRYALHKLMHKSILIYNK